jgi:membrane fusion protein, multidrug efflux system
MRIACLAAAVLVLATPPGFAAAAGIATAAVQAEGAGEVYIADGYVEAIRQSAIAAQVPGRVTALTIKAGDAVKSGQVLARIDERAAAQQVAASEAQAAAAQAQLDAARSDYGRSHQLYQKQYISQAAMDQAEARFKSAQAQTRAMLAQAAAAGTQTSFHALQAPYGGIVASVVTELGDMAVPGKPLITLYDPSALRVVATVPERYAGAIRSGGAVKLEFPGASDALRWSIAESITVLPTYDATSHTVQVRLDMKRGTPHLAPGTFVRVHFAIAGNGGGALTIPLKAVIRRSELHGVYVADANGQFSLRQVRLGRITGDRVVVLAGLTPGERVALDPVAASRH